MEAVRVAVGRGEAVRAGCHSVVVNLNVRLRGWHQVDVHFGVALHGCRSCVGSRCPWGCRLVVLTPICSELEVALADILAIVDSVNFALSHVAQVMLSEFILVAGLVVHGVSAEVVVGHSLLGVALLLGQELRLVVLADAAPVCLVEEEPVVLVRRRPVIRHLLKPHLEVGDSHGPGIADVGHLLEGQFLRGIGVAGRGFFLKLGWAVGRLLQREVGVPALRHELCIGRLRARHLLRIELVLNTGLVQILSRGHRRELCQQ